MDDVKVNKTIFLYLYSFNCNLDLGVCTEFELEVFPKRMNIWLGEILDALFTRKDLDAKYEVLVNEARKMKLSSTEKWWRNAVLWEFCELDQTHDK